MMWLGVDSVGSKPVEPELYSSIDTKGMYMPNADKIIKIGNSEFTGELQNNDYLILVDDSKFNYTANWSKEIQKARHVASQELRQARQEGYAQGVEAQKKSEEKKIFLGDLLKLYDGSGKVYCSLYLDKGDEPEFIGNIPIEGKVTNIYKNYIVKKWFLYGADADLNIYLEGTYEDDRE